MPELFVDPSAVLASRILGTLVFGFAVVGKVRHHDEFVGVVANYRILPERLAAPGAWLVVILEGFVVLSLLSGVQLSAGAACAVLLLLGFAVAMTINLMRGRTSIDCGCFQSALRQYLSPALVLRNIVLAAALAPLVSVAAGPAPVALQWLNGAGAGIVLFVLYRVFDQVLALREAAKKLQERFG